jgi:hypothetical protein
MFRDLYRSRPYVVKSLRSIKLLWWKLPPDPAHVGDERIDAREAPNAAAIRSSRSE